ncbi:MauE/DoxX family redox-associated membrane protein [Tenacibaculum ovolyticum]|uniref:MauE/DoxX family redox-associated membrane protein n=1 Tax=Tenacibaculum ovolyticum TaxID=104270 RepID=UPI000403ED38|nr:MauE/DoxX family redox-associated membrane protein [Tenacibaculum ovolyticum]
MNVLQLIPIKSLDAEILPYDGNGNLVVHNKLNHYVKITELVTVLLELVDGKKTVTELSEKFSEAINKDVSAEKVYEILYKDLGKYQIIENDLYSNEIASKPDYLKLSFDVIPEKIVAPIAKLIAPLFSKTIFYPIQVSCLIFIAFIGVNYWGEVTFESFTNLPFSKALFIGVVIVVTLFLHEFGHAAACNHFGGKHGNIGFGFYLLSPVMFADVSDIWKLTKKQRIVVNLAGLHIQVLIATLFGVLFLFTHKIEFLVLVYLLGILSVLVNLNPFFRTDGYWVLSDITGVNNLRANSNQKIKQFFGQFIQKNVFIYSKKNILLFLYALISNSFIVVFLGWILITDYNAIFSYPITIYNLIEDFLKGGFKFDYNSLKKLTIPLLFYYILFRFLKKMYQRMKVIKTINTKEVLWIGVHIVLSVIYLLSAVGKTLDFSPFKQKVLEYAPNIGFLAYFIIALEYFLALSFATWIFKKVVPKVSIAFLLMLSLVYSYGYFQLGIKECDCFGSFDVLNSSKIEVVLLKNTFLLLLSFFLLKQLKTTISKRTVKILISIVIVFLTTFQVFKFNASKSSGFVFKNIGNSIYDSGVTISNEMKKAEYWFLFSPNCIHCKNAIPHMNDIANGGEKVIGISILEKKEDFNTLKNSMKVDFPVEFITRNALRKLTKNVPVLLTIKNDTVIKVNNKIGENLPD